MIITNLIYAKKISNTFNLYKRIGMSERKICKSNFRNFVCKFCCFSAISGSFVDNK